MSPDVSRPSSDHPGDASIGLSRLLWCDSSKSYPLWISVCLLLGITLGCADLWAHEATWAVICREMMRSGDYLHPYLFDEEYYDKPLLSYWMMIGVAKVLGHLDEWALRIPGALAGLLTVFCTYRLGLRLFGRAAGLMAGWMLATCFVFTHWARIATADILNIAAITAGVTWYFERREKPGMATYVVFFLILALGAQMKGLVAPAIVVLVLLPDLLNEGKWKRHLRFWAFYAAMAVGIGLYLLPFLLSSASGGGAYRSSGLGEAFRENALRYVQAFDHRDVFYVYAAYLPLYALPWTLLLPLVLWRAARRWKELNAASRWPLLASLIIFAFLTLSRSRRNYYILPILPFLVLAVVDWIRSRGESSRWKSASAWVSAVSFLGLLAFFGAVVPYVETKGGVRRMAKEIREQAEPRAPWKEWQILLVSCPPHLGYYLEPSGRPHRINADQEEILTRFVAQNPRTVVVTSIKWLGHITPLLPPGVRIYEQSRQAGSLGKPKEDKDAPVALILSPR